jgi:hypothetical protein
MENRNLGSLAEYSKSFISFVGKNVSHSAINVEDGKWQRLPGILDVPVCDLKTWKRNWEIYRGNIKGRSAPCPASPCCTEKELEDWLTREQCELKEGGVYCLQPAEEEKKNPPPEDDEKKRKKKEEEEKKKKEEEEKKKKRSKPKPNDDKKGGGAPFSRLV